MSQVVTLSFAVAAALALTLSGCSIERQAIFPGAATLGSPSATLPQSSDYELVTLKTKDGTRIVAQFGTARGAPADIAPGERPPTVLYFYGNGSSLANSADIFNELRQRGANVLVTEYPGYGMSQGKPNEPAFYAAADAAYDFLAGRPEVDAKKFIAMGWSMGAGVAIDLASRRPMAGVITVSAFTTLPKVAKKVTPWLPVSLLLRSRFDNETKIASLHCPILLLHGTADTLVPASMADELAAAASSGSARVQKIPGAGHNDVFFAGGAAMWNSIADFIRSTAARTK